MLHSAIRKPASVLPTTSVLSGGSAGGLLHALFARLVAWQRRAEERRQLRRLSDHQLKDMGLTRAEAEEMARRPVWSRPV